MWDYVDAAQLVKVDSDIELGACLGGIDAVGQVVASYETDGDDADPLPEGRALTSAAL